MVELNEMFKSPVNYGPRTAPKCCHLCRNIATDGDWDGLYEPFYYCKIGVFLPTKKQSCKRMQPAQRGQEMR